MNERREKYATVLDFSTLEIIILDIGDLPVEIYEYQDILEMAEKQNIISNSNDCQIMISENLIIKREKLKL